MRWMFIAIGFVAGFLGMGNLLVFLVHHLPYARSLAKTHEVAKAQRTDGKLDLWYGPVPYARIILGQLLFTAIFIAVALVVAIFSTHFDAFCIGVAAATVLVLIGLPDPKGRFKRDMNLTVGDNWWSQMLEDGFGTLQDEQKLRDIPHEVNQVRDLVLSNEGIHEDSPDIQSALQTFLQYDKPKSEGQDHLRLRPARFTLERYTFPKLLIDYSRYQDLNGEVTHHFSSTVGRLRIEQ